MRKYREVIGFILLGAPLENFFDKNHHRFYQRLSQIISKAIVNAILFTKAKQQDEFISLLDELGQSKLKQKSFETTLDFCLGSLINLLGAERSSLMRYNPRNRQLKVCAAKGYKVYPVSGSCVRWGEGIAGLALKDSKIVSISKMKEPKPSNGVDRFLTFGEASEVKVKSLLCVPLFDAQIPLGVINISTINFYKSFDKSEVEMAHQIGNRISSILRNLS